MDTLAALAFGGEPALFRYMSAPPIRRDEAIVDPYMWSSIILGGCFVAGMSVVALLNDHVAALFVRGTPAQPDPAVFMTAFFSFFIFICVINAFNVRTKRVNIFESITQNRGFLLVLVLIFIVQIVFTYLGGKVLRTVPLRPEEWLWIAASALIILPFDALRKLVVAPWLPRSITETGASLDGDTKADKVVAEEEQSTEANSKKARRHSRGRTVEGTTARRSARLQDKDD